MLILRLVATAAIVATIVVPAGGAQEPPVLLAAGDIAGCNSQGDEATAAILDGQEGIIATLGDNAYPAGTLEDFALCYEPSWGRHKTRTRPTPGNHEYRTPGAAGYFAYFGVAAGQPGEGYYSYDLGSWHVLALNSQLCFMSGCGPGSPQEQWLRKDLAAHPAACTLAYWHHPRFSSGRLPQLSVTEPFWKALYEHGADVIVSGHDHIYERLAPQTPIGDHNAIYGVRQFTVGTGGHSHSFVWAPLTTSEAVNGDAFGVLKLTLRPEGYDWVFLPEPGRMFTDSGSGRCHDRPPDTTPPTAVLTQPADGAVVRGSVALSAQAGDDTSVARVDFLVGGTVVASDRTAPYAILWDTTTTANGPALVEARAVDRSGNATTSPPRTATVSNPTIVGTPGRDVLMGTVGDDVIWGRGGNDRIRGGRGNDTIEGGPGRDVLYGDAGADRLVGGPGRDMLVARDGARDRVYGGLGRDRARADRFLDWMERVEGRF
jgi:Bacterial Ig domain/RTX calcium-binding nonapeptide repeat (4 copies)/Calcineurin-like phosphoesterase